MTLTANPGSAAYLKRHCRRCLFSILIFGAFPLGCATPATTHAGAGITFDHHEVITGSAQSQTVLTGYLLGGAVAELAVVNIDANEDRRLRVYMFSDGTWAPGLDVTLRSGVLFVDVANIGGHDRLITYEHGRISWFDPEAEAERTLVAVTSSVKAPPSGSIPHVDVTRDVNDDDRDDLVVPDVDGSWVFIQMADGKFADPVKIGRAVNMGWVYEAYGYRYDPWDAGRIHKMDYNRDGRSDLVFWNDDHFVAHLQTEHGRFTPMAETFTTEVVFDSDDPGSIASPQGFRTRRKDHMPTGKMSGTLLHSLTDMNGDGVADLTVFSLGVESMWSVHSSYEVYFGAPSPEGGTAFAPDVSTAIHTNGVPLGLGLHDFDHDGQVDLMFTTIKVGSIKTIGMIISAVLTRAVPLRLEFYRMEGGVYPDKPNATRRIKTDSLGKSGERAAVFPPVLIGDVSGDKHLDVLVGRSRKELRTFLGVPAPDFFDRQPHRVAVAMPNEEYTWMVDLNKDGKQDILMHHPSATELHRVSILIAR